MITFNLWIHICHEFIYSIVRVFICSDKCVWVLWIHWIHKLICYLNSFICVKPYVTTNYMNSLNTWFDLTAEFTLIIFFYNSFHFYVVTSLHSIKVGTVERNMQEIKEEFNKVVLSICGLNIGRDNEVCLSSYKNKKKMQVEKWYKGIAG